MISVHENFGLQKKIICHLINSTQDSLNRVTNETAYGVLRNIMQTTEAFFALQIHYSFTVRAWVKCIYVYVRKKAQLSLRRFSWNSKKPKWSLKIDFHTHRTTNVQNMDRGLFTSPSKTSLSLRWFSRNTISCAEFYPDQEKNVENRIKFN